MNDTSTETNLDLHDVTREVLAECIRSITGRSDLPPREGQIQLMGDLTDAFAHTHDSARSSAGRLLGEAPTGTGKSFAYLVPAMVMAALHRERTAISTEMISLQTQIIDKDAPVVAAAVEKITGYRPTFALMKGFNNYACLHATIEAAGETPGIIPPGKGQGSRDDLHRQASAQRLLDPHDERLELLEWVFEQYEHDAPHPAATNLDSGDVRRGAARGLADKNTYPGSLADSRLWDSVSLSSADCVGEATCHFADVCRPRMARRRAAAADIVVTNHHLLAVQAAKDVPVVLGSKKLGNFEHLVIDEAHGLPSIVRDIGAVEVSSRAIERATKALDRVFTEDDANSLRLGAEAKGIAARLDMELREWTDRIKKNEDVLRLGPEDDPLGDLRDLIAHWAKDAIQQLQAAAERNDNQTLQLKARRAVNVFANLVTAVREASDHRAGCARWVEVERPHPKAKNQTPYPVVRFTPVAVGGMLDRNVWNCEAVPVPEGAAPNGTTARLLDFLESFDAGDQEGPRPRFPVTVAALSATLPRGFGQQISIRTEPRSYASPFDNAYGSSMLYVARARHGSPDVEALRQSWSDRPRLDTSRHTDWAVQHMLDLVEANGGSALILAATVTAGRRYTEALTNAAAGRWRVLSQWDGPTLRTQVSDWKADRSAVLVGVKSLSTGVDAPGDTCSLVIIDRPPRARANPVDDARVEMLIESGMDKWAAIERVYVCDAAAMLSQSAGRLIRSVSDAGMVAVLDPRLLKSSPFTYPSSTREEYMASLSRFRRKTSDLVAAKRWLQARHSEGTGEGVVEASA